MSPLQRVICYRYFAIWGVRYREAIEMYLLYVFAIWGVRYREVFAIWGVHYREYLLYGVSAIER